MNPEILHGVEKTAIIPLLEKAKEYNRKNPILRDESAHKIVSELRPNEGDFRLNRYSAVSSLYRAAKFDSYVREYLATDPDGLVVEIGAGLDDRMVRVDNGRMRWISVDLPEMIELRRKLIPPAERESLVDTPLEKLDWSSFAAIHPNPLIISEGVFPYFTEEYGIKTLKALGDALKGQRLCFDAIHSFVVKKQKFKSLEASGARLGWGIDGAEAILAILPGCKVLEEWRYYDEFKWRNGIANLFHFVPSLNNLFRVYKIRL